MIHLTDLCSAKDYVVTNHTITGILTVSQVFSRLSALRWHPTIQDEETAQYLSTMLGLHIQPTQDPAAFLDTDVLLIWDGQGFIELCPVSGEPTLEPLVQATLVN